MVTVVAPHLHGKPKPIIALRQEAVHRAAKGQAPCLSPTIVTHLCATLLREDQGLVTVHHCLVVGGHVPTSIVFGLKVPFSASREGDSLEAQERGDGGAEAGGAEGSEGDADVAADESAVRGEINCGAIVEELGVEDGGSGLEVEDNGHAVWGLEARKGATCMFLRVCWGVR